MHQVIKITAVNVNCVNIFCVLRKFSPMKVLQIKFILFIFNVKYVPFLNFHKSLKLFEDNELVVYRNHLCLFRSENTCVEIHVSNNLLSLIN